MKAQIILRPDESNGDKVQRYNLSEVMATVEYEQSEGGDMIIVATIRGVKEE